MLTNNLQSNPQHQRYFQLPNDIFNLGLSDGAILVYTYLMYCEDRRTYKLLGVNDIYAVFCCNQKIEAIYCGYNSYPGRYGITSYAPVFGYVCNGTAYHEQTTLTVPYRLLRRMTEGNTYPIYIHSKHPGVYVLKRRIRFTTVIEFGFAIMFLVVAILWQQS